jgi:hypothetical protein
MCYSIKKFSEFFVISVVAEIFSISKLKPLPTTFVLACVGGFASGAGDRSPRRQDGSDLGMV